jgi:hypothetical protein
MKISKSILAIWLATSAWALTPPPNQADPNAGPKPSGGRAVSQAPKTPTDRRSTATKVAPVKAAPMNAKLKPATDLTKLPVLSSARKPGGQKAPGVSVRRMAMDGKTPRKGVRDPFVSPIIERIRSAATCSGSGRQCLLVGEITLHGVVRSPNGFIAVVMNGEHTYFLRENDPLADGDVARITRDAITLRQRSSDVLGRPTVREVTRKLGVPAV